MAEGEKKPMSVGQSLSSSAGIGTLLACIVGIFDVELATKFAPAIPIISSGLTYAGVWCWSRWGCESPDVAAVRNKLERDAKALKKIVNDPIFSEATKAQAKREYEQTMLQIATLGRSGLSEILAKSDDCEIETPS